MREYYDVFLPVALIIASAVRQPFDLAVLCVHTLVFPRTSGATVYAWQLTRTRATSFAAATRVQLRVTRSHLRRVRQLIREHG
jgi:hypothetical protein